MHHTKPFITRMTVKAVQVGVRVACNSAGEVEAGSSPGEGRRHHPQLQNTSTGC